MFKIIEEFGFTIQYKTTPTSGQYLGEQGVLAAGLQGRVVPVLHGQPAVDVEAGHEVGLAGLRVLQALRDEGGTPLGQQQELFDTLYDGRGFYNE